MSFAHLKPFGLAVAATVATGVAAFGDQPSANGGPDDRRPVFLDAVGSWLGRAVPVPGETICPPGAPGCPVPPEIVMIFTVNAEL